MLVRVGLTSVLVASFALLAAERATLSGRITDSAGKPLEDATVLVYRAGVKKGYSTYCPTCYVDCGKRTITSRTGAYTIQGLNPELWFDLVVIRDGFVPILIKKIDTSKGSAPTAVLMPRAEDIDSARVVRGRVIDANHKPVRYAVIEPEGISGIVWQGRGPKTVYGSIEGLEPFAVTNQHGDFEIAYVEKASGMLLRVEPRAMAPKVLAVPTGADRKIISLSDGAAIRGRLVQNGKPVAGAEIGLIGRPRGSYGGDLAVSGNPHKEFRIGTQEDGSFVITNVPAPADWYVYGKMESIASRGATPIIECATARAGEEVNVGDIEIGPGHRIRGKVTLSDGGIIGEGMRVIISSERAWDSQTAILRPDGAFEFVGLFTGKYEINNPAVRGYELEPGKWSVETTVDRDLQDFEIKLLPASRR